MIGRKITYLKDKSFFLFGARGVGKSTFLDHEFSQNETLLINLLDPVVLDELTVNPARFLDYVREDSSKSKRIVIDEVQRLPKLLDFVQLLIQKEKRKFILTGSSARRLKQVSSNLLAGRANVYHLFPFSTFELGASFDLQKALTRGGLPDSYLAESDQHHTEYLTAYIYTYIEKEIQQEQWVRKLEPFRKFLRVAAQMNGKIINYSAISRDIGVDDVTVKQYFEILEDTLIGFHLPSYHKSVRKSQRVAPKFYLFDPGVKRALDRTLSVPLLEQTSAFGDFFEHWVILEFVKNIEYQRKDWSLSYVRSRNDIEIDLVIERPGKPLLLVEIKSKIKVSEEDAFALETIGKDLDLNSERYLLSRDPLKHRYGKTSAMLWTAGLKEIFDL